MERLWEHVEHLTPGLVLAMLLFFSLSSTVAVVFPVPDTVPRDPVLIGGAFIAFGYLLGVINSSLSRLFVADLIPLLDWFRWRHLVRAARNSPALNGAIANSRWGADFETVEAHVNAGAGFPWSRDSKLRRARAVFSSLAGRAQMVGGPLAVELAQRRREARLMRSAVFPAIMAGVYLASKSDVIGVGAIVVTVVLILIGYYSREISVIETFEAYAEALYQKNF